MRETSSPFFIAHTEKQVKDQHKHINGYRDLTAEEIATINEIKELGARIGELSEKIANIPNVNMEDLKLGKREVQQGFMWIIRSVARPTTFC